MSISVPNLKCVYCTVVSLFNVENITLKSLETAPFKRSHSSFYSHSIVTMAPILYNFRDKVWLQSAYWHRHSTEMALLYVTNMVCTAADAKKITVLLGLHISVAFNTVVIASHLHLKFSVVGAASSWLRSYLCSHQQFMHLGGHSSPTTQVQLCCTAGFSARLGSVYCLRVSCWRADRVIWHVIPPHHFADDTQLLVSSTNATLASGPASVA